MISIFFPAAADNAGNVAGSAAAALNGTAIKAAAGAAGTAVGLATAGSGLAAGAVATAGSGLAAGAAATAGSGLAAGAAATAGSGLAAGAAMAAGSSLAVVESSKQSAVAVLKHTARQETSPLKAPLFTKFAARYPGYLQGHEKTFAFGINTVCCVYLSSLFPVHPLLAEY
jgi:hypothetical protein